jgi:hypothetical protein
MLARQTGVSVPIEDRVLLAELVVYTGRSDSRSFEVLPIEGSKDIKEMEGVVVGVAGLG